MSKIPKIITEDRSKICEIISKMLDNPDKHGIYPTTEAYNELEALLSETRIQAMGWTWAEACIIADKGERIQAIEISSLIPMAMKDLNPDWESSRPT